MKVLGIQRQKINSYGLIDKERITMKNIGKTIKALKYLCGALFIIVIVFCGLYQFRNQNILMVIETNAGKNEYKITTDETRLFYDKKDEKSQGENVISEYSVVYDGISEQEIQQICFYRSFDSICIDKIPSGEIYQYANIDGDNIIFNDNGCDLIKGLSESYIMERIIYVEIALLIVLLVLIILNVLGERFDVESKNNHGPLYELKRFGNELVKYKEYIFFAAKADLNAEVANSYLNRLWWLLEPFFNMFVYVIVFGQVMGSSVENYATYVFSSLLMWNYFNHIINYSVKCIRNNRDIVTKIYMPKYVLLLTNMVLNFIKLLFSLIVLVVMLFIFKVHIGIAVLWVVPTYMVMMLLSFGGGMIFMHYGVFVDDLAYAVGILLNMIMFLSGVFYDVITTLPSPLNLVMLSVNPIALFVDTMRSALLYNKVTNVPLIIIWSILSLLITYIGLHTVYKNENGYVKVI